jgi:riboflavin kinase/FMN adenylyltransferase
MKVFRDLSEYNEDIQTVLTIGNFDGVHLGHQKILNKMYELSKQYGFRSAVFTFEPHPMKFFGADVPMLQTPRQKIKMLEDAGTDYLFELQFGENFAKMPPDVFIREIIVKKLRARFIIVGYDYKFGYRRKGDYNLLKFLSSSYGYTPFKIDRVEVDGMVVSSTNIRNLIRQGNITLANKMLGRAFSLEGIVEHGSKIGRLLGYPTANINIENEILPKTGVYASRLCVDGVKYNSATNIGVRPTFDFDTEDVRVEVFIFNFHGDLYGKRVELELVEYLRPEKKFDSFDALREAIASDCKTAEGLLK